MKLNFYKKFSKNDFNGNGLHFYQPQKMQSDEDGLPGNFDQPFSVDEVFSVIQKGLVSGKSPPLDRFYYPYFFDPIHGYCECGEVLTQLQKGIVDPCILSCGCVHTIEFLGKNIDTFSREDFLKTSEKRDFPKDFVKVLCTKLYKENGKPVYMFSSLNAMDVKQISPTEFDVGIGYYTIGNMFLDYGFKKNETYEETDIYLNEGDAKNTDHFQEHLTFYETPCKEYIMDGLDKGIIPKDELYVHGLTLTHNSPRFENRVYVRKKDYDEVKKENQELSLYKSI